MISRSCSRRVQPVPAAMVAFALLLTGLAVNGASAQSPRPVMRVDFSISSGPFDSLDAADKTQIATAVANRVIESASRRWGFLDWMPGAPAAEASANWIVQLESEPRQLTLEDGTVFPDSIVRLNHYVVLEGKPFGLHQTEAAKLLYDFGAPKPLQSPDQLVADLLDKLDEQLDPLLKSLDVETALRKIPVSDKLIVDAEHKRIVVPLRLREDLRAEEESVFRVGLVSGDAMSGRFKLEESGAVADEGEQRGFIVGKVVDWDVQNLPVTVPAPWIDELPTLLESADRIVVFMFVYNPSLSGATASVNGVILDPGP